MKSGQYIVLVNEKSAMKVKHLYNEVVYCNNCFTFHGGFLVDKHNVLKLVKTFSNKKPLQNTVTNKPRMKRRQYNNPNTLTQEDREIHTFTHTCTYLVHHQCS